MLAATRQRRANAGNRMAMLLESEDPDQFYTSVYGGFQEEEDDKDFSGEDEDSEDTDSDISVDEKDEKDEPESDHEEEEKTRRQRRVVTKAYKEPKKTNLKKESAGTKTKKVTFQVEPKVKKTELKGEAKMKKAESLMESKQKKVEPEVEQGKKRMRESTTRKSLEVQERIEARAKQNQDRRKKKTQGNVLTQKELLEEAKLTEIENLKSLEMFQRLELEKKKNKVTKKTCTGPMIRYHSVAMPSIEVIEEKDGKEENKTVGQYSRNFITFTDEDTMKEIFNYEKPEPVIRSRCVVTGLPARYFDPLTKQPFFNCTAFRIIREAYYRQVEKKVNPELPHVARWLEWRENVKAARQAAKTFRTP